MPIGTLAVNEKGGGGDGGGGREALNEIGYTATATTTVVFTTSYMFLLIFVQIRCLCRYIFSLHKS